MNKIEWIRNLKVGDVVCDCRYKHIKISEIEEDWGVVAMPEWLRSILHANWMPDTIFFHTYSVWSWANEKLGRLELYDKTLILEDGASCSARHCCDQPDHDESIHAEAIEATRKWNEDV